VPPNPCDWGACSTFLACNPTPPLTGAGLRPFVPVVSSSEPREPPRELALWRRRQQLQFHAKLVDGRLAHSAPSSHREPGEQRRARLPLHELRDAHLDPRLAALAASVRVEALRSAEAALAGAAPQLARPLAALLFALSPKLALLPLLRARRAPLLTAFLAAHAADDTLSLLAAPRAVAAAEALHGVGLALAALLLRLLPWGWAARYSPAAPQPRSRRAPSRAGAPAGTMSRALTPSLPFPLRVPLL